MRNLKIAFIDLFGQEYNATTLERRGLGGSESAVIYMSRELAALGHNVVVFNNCEEESESGPFNNLSFRPISQMGWAFDVVISVRSVVPFLKIASEELGNLARGLDMPTHFPEGTLKILWKHDTYCDADAMIPELLYTERLDYVFTLSDWHTEHLKEHLKVLDEYIWQTRNGVQKFEVFTDKDPNKFVWNAAAFKGLPHLMEEIWPRVKELIPEATLDVIGGYYEGFEDGNKQFCDMNMYKAHKGVEYWGVVTPEKAAEIMAKATYMIYPPDFPETFGISTLEAQMYGTIPITYDRGALKTTAIDHYCYKCVLDPMKYPEAFAATVYQAWKEDISRKQDYCAGHDWVYHYWATVADEWSRFFEQELAPVESITYSSPDLSKTSILIAVPSAIHIEPETFKSIYDLIIPDGYRCDFQFFFGYLVDQVRNTIARYAVKCGYDYVLCVDSDIELPRDTLVKALTHRKDFVAGLYRMRRPEQHIEVYDDNYQLIPVEKLNEGELLEIGGCGFGCVLLKTEMFDTVGYPQFEYHQAEEFHNTFSEDNDFCKKAREKGYKLYADPTIRCRHKGTVMWEIETD